MKKRSTMKRLNVGGRLIEAVTVRGLADIIGKSRDAVFRYEELGYFPPAPLKKGTYRYYPLTLCQRLKPIVAKFPVNRPPSAELIVEINKVFNEERNLLCQ